MNRSRVLSGFAVASLFVAPLFVLSPASATTLDVAGATFNFANPNDENIGDSAQIGDEFFYDNVTTVGGVSVDAVVTVVDASESSIGNEDMYEEIDQAGIDAINVTDSESVDVPGCYYNDDYADAIVNSQPYDFSGFVDSDRLGEEVQTIDEFYDDPAYEGAINTSTSLCLSPVDGFVSLRVDFEVNGDPVTLNNLSIYAGDIDNEQYLTLSSPKPTTWTVSPETELSVEESAGEISFVSPDIASDEADPTANNFVGEAQYDGVSSITYTFGLVNAGGGSLSMQFDSFFNPDGDLASTGVDAAPAGLIGFAALGLGAAVVVARRVRRNRA